MIAILLIRKHQTKLLTCTSSADILSALNQIGPNEDINLLLADIKQEHIKQWWRFNIILKLINFNFICNIKVL